MTDQSGTATGSSPLSDRERVFGAAALIGGGALFVLMFLVNLPVFEITDLLRRLRRFEWQLLWVSTATAAVLLAIGLTTLFRYVYARGEGLLAVFGAAFAWMMAGATVMAYTISVPAARLVTDSIDDVGFAAFLDPSPGRAELGESQLELTLLLMQALTESLVTFMVLFAGLSIALLGLALVHTATTRRALGVATGLVGAFLAVVGGAFFVTGRPLGNTPVFVVTLIYHAWALVLGVVLLRTPVGSGAETGTRPGRAD